MTAERKKPAKKKRAKNAAAKPVPALTGNDPHTVAAGNPPTTKALPAPRPPKALLVADVDSTIQATLDRIAIPGQDDIIHKILGKVVMHDERGYTTEADVNRDARDQVKNDLNIIAYAGRLAEQGCTDGRVSSDLRGEHCFLTKTETMNEVIAKKLPKTPEEEARCLKYIIEEIQAALTKRKQKLSPEHFQQSLAEELRRARAIDEDDHVEVLEEERQKGNPFPPLPCDPPITTRPPDALWLYRAVTNFSVGRALLYLIRRYPESESELRQGVVATYEVLEAKHAEALAEKNGQPGRSKTGGTTQVGAGKIQVSLAKFNVTKEGSSPFLEDLLGDLKGGHVGVPFAEKRHGKRKNQPKMLKDVLKRAGLERLAKAIRKVKGTTCTYRIDLSPDEVDIVPRPSK